MSGQDCTGRDICFGEEVQQIRVSQEFEDSAGFLLLPSLPFGHQLTKIFLLSWCMCLSHLISVTGEEIWLEK